MSGGGNWEHLWVLKQSQKCAGEGWTNDFNQYSSPTLMDI